MAEPEIAQKRPAAVELERGAHYWCACGRSKNQPFCDGAHKGTEFHPHEIVVPEEKEGGRTGRINRPASPKSKTLTGPPRARPTRSHQSWGKTDWRFADSVMVVAFIR